MDSDSDDEDFNLTAPPLSVFIKGILQRYPDGCQLKELLQNAEDAGATVVKFLHDRNSYGRNNLFQRNLSCCQGPALCAYNNARFEKCDWKGILEPQRSHKADSVLKVGKFGIGFNSVYHLTDIPWILSGNRLAVIEPTESLFNGTIRGTVARRSAFQWKLKKMSHINEMANSWDQFVPIEAAAEAMNDAGFVEQWHYDGTLIRLPFRTAPSTLSETVYDQTMVENLFENFSSEIEEILLFLSNLETIQIWDDANYQVNVSISPSSIPSVRSNRAQLNQEIEKIVEFRKRGVKIRSALAMNMTLNIDSDLTSINQSKTWIVSHFVPNHSNAPASWALEHHVKRLPWVSLAAQVETPVKGRIFCFLPLPNNLENMTGLPVHVNAFFGLEDNRRNLKWPSADQTRDSEANWNAALVKEVIPVAYVQLIRFCVENYAEESYKLWPHVDFVHGRWEAILAPFFKLLFDQPVLKISCPGGSWTILDAKMYVDNLSETNNEEVAAAVRRCLNQTKTPYVHVPSNILKAVNKYGDKRRINYTDCNVVCRELRKLRSWDTIGYKDRLLLLQYFVANFATSPVLPYIKDFPIIPLVSGAYGKLSSTNLYLASEAYQNLLPTLGSSIINVENLPVPVVKFLDSKIKTIDKANFPQLLKESLPNSWNGGEPINFNLNASSFPNKSWLQQLWRYLRETYPRDLSQFENLTILDCPKDWWTLLPLPSSFVSRLFVENSFPANIESLLKLAGAISVPANLLSRHKHLVNYIHEGSASSLVQLLQNCSFSSIKSVLERTQDEFRNDIVAYFAEHIDEITSDGKKVIRKLPLFEILRPSDSFSFSNVTSIAEHDDVVAVNFDGLPELIETDIPYLDCRNRQVDKIRQLLGIEAITREEIANQIVEDRSSYSSDDFSSLMLWAFDYIHPRCVRDYLTNHNFVPSDDGQYHAPSALFDPKVSSLQNLFYAETGRFPSGDYNTRIVLDTLRNLGLRTITDLTADEIMRTARLIHSAGFQNNTKLICFNQVLLENFSKLNSKQIAEMKKLKLFQAKINRPPDYPKQLYWFGSDKQGVLYSAAELAQHDCALIVGSVSPISNSILPIQLGDTDRTGLILKQLKILSSLSPKECTTHQVEMMQDIVLECYKTLQSTLKSASKHLEPLIKDFSTLPVLLLNPVAFVPYQYVCSDRTWENCAPYLYSIEGTVYEKYADLLLKFGVKQAFSIEDYIDALQRMKKKEGKNRLPSDTLQIAVHLCKNISDALDESPANPEGMLIPDEKGILFPVSSLTFWELDMKEIPKKLMAGANFCHRKIPRDIALKLGVRIQREMVAEKFYIPFEYGESFGQHEDLTTRIHNILDEYSSNSDVINEMIQNADDAGASEIRFILDQRQLPTDSNLLSENWKHLQGPSLIVYNNKTFEEKDFKGIRDLGLGSKREDSHLTGKFGIGFNTVFRLTDVPMFISDNATLCVLDPHKQYVPTATVKAPGGKFPLSEDFKATYANIMLGFEPVNDLQFGKSTVFRLPLRSTGQVIPSKIADPIDLEELMGIFKTFESQAADFFFFLNNVEKIRISYVGRNGKLYRDLSFVSEMSKEDRNKKKTFLKALRSKKEHAENETVVYRITVSSDVKSEKFKWQILQSLSCMKDELPPEVAKLRETGKLKASPLVGIAMPLHANYNDRRTYTTLPLPGSNGLPIHVNGKFMLDQGRKHCHLEGDGSYKKQWNEYLITKVLAPLYIQALEIVKTNVDSEWGKTHSDRGDDIKYQERLVKQYQRYLPTTKDQQPIGRMLLKEIYRLLHKNDLQLTFGLKIDNYSRRTLMWLPMSEGVIDTFVEKEAQLPVILSSGVTRGQKKDNKPIENDHIRSILERVHFPKYHLGFNCVVNDICSTVEMEPNVITPNAVAEHMKKVEDYKLVLNVREGKLPIELKKTILSKDMIYFCLKYILKEEKVELANIPLMLTADGNLRRFSEDYEVYGAQNSELLPSQGNLFCSWSMKFLKLPSKYCRTFDVAILAKHLHNELPDLFGECQKKPRPKNMDLIAKIFQYLAEDSKNRKSVLERVRPLEGWALLPVSVFDARDSTKNFLVALRNAPIVIFPGNITDKLKELYRCLRKLGVMFADVEDFFKSISKLGLGNLCQALKGFFSYLCACPESPETIVNVLYSALSNEFQEANFDRLESTEKKVLLDFIIESFSHPIEPNETHIMKTIRSLPLFPTLEGNFVNLEAGCDYIVCTKPIEGAELDKLKALANTILLKEKLHGHEKFCTNLNISIMSDVDLYAKYIIPYLAEFSINSIFEHLDFLRVLIWSKERDALYKQLGRTPFIRMKNGQFKAFADLYSDSIKKEFETMIAGDEFLPTAFSVVLTDKKKDLMYWDSFLQNLGLKYELSAHTFIQLAKNLESEYSDKETLKLKSQKLVNYLAVHCYEMKNKFKPFVNQVSQIRFICNHVIAEDLGFLHPQTLESNGLICYRNSVLCRNERVCWTVSKLLPKWSLKYDLKSEMKDLGCLEQPTVEDVTTHTENICNRLQKLKFEENTTTKINGVEEIQLLGTVLKEIFRFLKDKLDQKSHLVDILRKVPCILVENGRALVCPDQVVFQSSNIAECPPFLYNLPSQLYSFLEVLQKIGTEKLVTHRHYSSALKMFHTTYGEGPILNPNVKESLKNAYVGFLKKLSANDAKDGAILPVIEEELYLPDERFCLVKSTQIIVLVDKIDKELLAKMDGKKWNTAMIAEMDESVQTFASALLRLPTLIRPKSYDHYITISLSDNCEKCAATFCQHKYDIQRLFHDSMFVRVVTKVINRYSLHEEGREAKQDEMAAFFNDVTVSCYAILKTAKLENGTKKLLKETSVATYWHNIKSNTVDFMVVHEYADMNTSFVDTLVNLVNSVCPFKSLETASHFSSIVDKLNLSRQNDTLQLIASRKLADGDIEDDYRPQLGSFVPDDVIDLLDQNPFNYYKSHEYIAFPSEFDTDDQESYIYGRIIEKIEELDNEGELTCRYRVDVGGNEPVEKKALDIYKFISNKQLNREMQKEFPELPLVCSDSQDDHEIDRLSRPMQEIMDEISDQIEEIWRMPPEDRKRAIRRLYLQWHPDKHPDKKEVCEEACKFLQNEVRRVESGLPRKKRNEAKPSKFWDCNFGRWDNRARRDRKRRRNYNKRARDNWEYFSAPRSSDVPPSFAKSLNAAAKLWCQQAEFDLDAALSEGSSIEWIFYKCYQVARKCLIALLFTKSPYENQNTNLMELTSDVLEAFGDDPGEVYESVKFLVSKEVDEVRPLKPLCGKTNHQNYLQYSECCTEVLGAAKKLLNVAKRCASQKPSGTQE